MDRNADLTADLRQSTAAFDELVDFAPDRFRLTLNATGIPADVAEALVPYLLESLVPILDAFAEAIDAMAAYYRVGVTAERDGSRPEKADDTAERAVLLQRFSDASDLVHDLTLIAPGDFGEEVVRGTELDPVVVARRVTPAYVAVLTPLVAALLEMVDAAAGIGHALTARSQAASIPDTVPEEWL